MAYKLTKEQFDNVMRLSADARYDYFVKKVADWGEIWSLADADGWVSLSADGEECFPVWPHPDYAASYAIEDWSNCKPKMITLDVWMDRWIAGLERDNTMVAIFPNEDEEGVVVSPAEIRDSLLDELESVD